MTYPLHDTFNASLMAQELIRDEGEVLHVYKDPGSGEAIGVGRNLTTQGISPAELAILGTTMDLIHEHGITHEQAMTLLDNDIADRAHQLDAYLPWWRLLSPVRQRVILNMAFEMGTHGMITYWEDPQPPREPLKMLAFVQAGQFKAAAGIMVRSPWGTGKTRNRAARLAGAMSQNAVVA